MQSPLMDQMLQEKARQDRPGRTKADRHLRATIESIPEARRVPALEDAVARIRGYSPAALDTGMGRRLTNEQVRDFIATEGHHPASLPDIILAGPDRALVREPDRSAYWKLVKESGQWYCGCGQVGCLHKIVLLKKLEARGRA